MKSLEDSPRRRKSVLGRGLWLRALSGIGNSPTEVRYPSSDSKPMPDSTWQAHTVLGQDSALLPRYKRDRNTFVGTNLLLYYREIELW